MLYHKTTSQKGPALVLLHGWGFHCRIWQSLLPYLSDYQVTLIDLPGFGRSELSIDLEQALLSQYAEQVLAVAPPEAVWLGWSMGGLVATQVALIAPERVTHLINVASTPCFASHDSWPGIELPTVPELMRDLKDDPSATSKRLLLAQLAGLQQLANLFKLLKQELVYYANVEIQAMKLGLQIIRATDLRTKLRSLQCHNDYILGELDSRVPVAIAEKLPALSDSLNVHVLKGATHLPFLSHTEMFVNQLEDCLHG